MLALKGLATVIGTLASRRPSRVITICFHILHRLYVEGGGVNLQKPVGRVFSYVFIGF